MSTPAAERRESLSLADALALAFDTIQKSLCKEYVLPYTGIRSSELHLVPVHVVTTNFASYCASRYILGLVT